MKERKEQRTERKPTTTPRNGHRTTEKLAISILLLLLLLAVTARSASALGVAPSRIVGEYRSHQTNSFRIINSDHRDINMSIYAAGELAKYVKLYKTFAEIKADEYETIIMYDVDLPRDLAPGPRTLEIVSVETGKKLSAEDATQISMSLSVAHEMIVNVPYPGYYAEGELFASGAEPNGSVEFTVSIVNRGTNKIGAVKGKINIRDPEQRVIATVEAPELQGIQSRAAGKISVNWAADANPGIYHAEYRGIYEGNVISLNKSFTVGRYHVAIKNIAVNNFRLGSVAKYDLVLESRWNYPLKDSFGVIAFEDELGTVLQTFKTGSFTIEPNSLKMIDAYWDTNGYSAGNYKTNVKIHYGDAITEQTFNTVVTDDEILFDAGFTTGNVIGSSGAGDGGGMGLLIPLILVSVIINVILFMYLRGMKRKTPPKSPPQPSQPSQPPAPPPASPPPGPS